MLSIKIIDNQASLPPCARKAILLGAKPRFSPLSTNHLSDNRVAPITMQNIQYGGKKHGADRNTKQMNQSAQQ